MTSTYRCIFLGGNGVGKTALLKRCLGEEFPHSYIQTIEETYSTIVQYDHFPVKLNIIDTNGQAGESDTRGRYYKDGEGFVIVYDQTNRDSFLRVKMTYQSIRHARCMEDSMSLPVLIIANKCDMSQHRAVQMGEGEMLARALKGAYLETSAKHGINVEEVFKLLITEIRAQGATVLGKGKKQSCCKCM